MHVLPSFDGVLPYVMLFEECGTVYRTLRGDEFDTTLKLAQEILSALTDPTYAPLKDEGPKGRSLQVPPWEETDR